jgi:hypothetical protein
MCGETGDPTALFKDVYLCVTTGCRVWTFEGGSGTAAVSVTEAEPRGEPPR